MAITNLDTLVANISLIEVAAEHGDGVIGTSDFGAPRTYRATQDGVIITQVKIDLTGLYEGDTINDVIGLAAGGIAQIGKNVVATVGLIFKAELSCIETPAGGDPDINVVENTTKTLVGNAAGGTDYVSGDSGDLAAGTTIQLLTPATTAGDWFYLTCGTSTGATYTAGQLIFTTWGHAVLS